MKVDIGGGTPIFISPRQCDGGATIHQGSSRVRMSRKQALAVINAMQTILMRQAQGAETNENGNT